MVQLVDRLLYNRINETFRKKLAQIFVHPIGKPEA